MSAANNQEIEYRYLLAFMPDFGDLKPSRIVQGYLSRTAERTRRIRIEELPDGTIKAFETIKGPKIGASASEDEKEITVDTARDLLKQCEGEFIEKDRYKIPASNGLLWEVDIFKGKLTGLFIAEIEVPAEGTHYTIPNWMNGVEITTDRRFANARLIDAEPSELKRMIDSVLNPAGFTAPTPS